jgi:HlyD family secretion protein
VKAIIRFAPEVDVLELVRRRNVGVDYRVRVRVFTRQRQGVLTAPRSAVFRGDDGGWETFVVRRGKVELQPIAVGLMNDEACEITEGLEEGESVVVAPDNSLQPGDRVRPASAP